MIRKAAFSDIFSIVALENKVFDRSLGENFLYEEFALNPFGYYFVYELNKTIVGYIGFRAIDKNAEMMNFAVDPDYQGQGYGDQILSFVLSFLQDKGVKTFVLEVRKSNERARKLYEKYGFTQSHLRKKYYENEDAIVYIKEVLS
jgi:[ribosomal protein S18]-alanine N-acetyltransferase